MYCRRCCVSKIPKWIKCDLRVFDARLTSPENVFQVKNDGQNRLKILKMAVFFELFNIINYMKKYKVIIGINRGYYWNNNS